MPAQPLEAPDIHHLRAASGWMDLGDAAEANLELEKIAASLQEHPDVLSVRWSILAASRNWEAAIDVAKTLRELAPDDSLGWIHSGYALHELKRTQEAFDTLKPVADRFPDCEIISYNLACYTAQLGKLDEARLWLRKAIKIGHSTKIKAMAKEDLDLKPLWPEINHY